MCGRISQYRHAVDYLNQLNLATISAPSAEPLGRYNVPPQSRVQLLHQDDDGLRMEAVKRPKRLPWSTPCRSTRSIGIQLIRQSATSGTKAPT